MDIYDVTGNFHCLFASLDAMQKPALPATREQHFQMCDPEIIEGKDKQMTAALAITLPVFSGQSL